MKFGDKHWIRKNRVAEFDITMGATDSAQVTDLVGLYLIHELTQEFPELEGGVYRDDALCIVSNRSTSEIERIKYIYIQSLSCIITMLEGRLFDSIFVNQYIQYTEQHK